MSNNVLINENVSELVVNHLHNEWWKCRRVWCKKHCLYCTLLQITVHQKITGQDHICCVQSHFFIVCIKCYEFIECLDISKKIQSMINKFCKNYERLFCFHLIFAMGGGTFNVRRHVARSWISFWGREGWEGRGEGCWCGLMEGIFSWKKEW